jgi:hypothetical protein
MKITPAILAKIFSILFLLGTALGFVSDLLPIGSALLETNTILIMAHLVLTLTFFFVAYLCTNMSIHSLQTIGITYILISGIGFVGLSIQINGEWPHVIYLNLLSYFQFALGVVLCASGSVLKNHQSKIAA